MISYKDRTFCKSDCVNKSCYRYFGEYQQAGRAQWWSHDPGNAPIAWADFSGHCGDYKNPSD